MQELTEILDSLMKNYISSFLGSRLHKNPEHVGKLFFCSVCHRACRALVLFAQTIAFRSLKKVPSVSLVFGPSNSVALLSGLHPPIMKRKQTGYEFRLISCWKSNLRSDSFHIG